MNWPIGMQFRFDSFIYFFIFLSTATLAYSWRTVLAMGMWTGALWVIAVGWAYLQRKPMRHAVGARQGRDRGGYSHVQYPRPLVDRFWRAFPASDRFHHRGGWSALAVRRSNAL